jgi:uncharacterized protein (TIGR04206 family)
MTWVRAEYAGALAVVSTWLAALVPWNVTYSPDVSGGAVLFVRFPFFQIRYTFGVPLTRRVAVSDPLSAIAFQAGQSIQVAYQVWAVGAGILAVAVAIAVVYYRFEDAVESGPVDPVRLLGGLLGLSGLALAASTYLLATRGFPGVPIPVGVLVLLVLGGVLLTVDRE